MAGLFGALQIEEIGPRIIEAVAPKHLTSDEHDEIELATILANFGPLVWLAPLSLLALRQREPRQQRNHIATICCTTVLVIWWWRTRDYGYAVAPFVAIAAAIGLRESIRLAQRTRPRALGYLVLCALTLVPINWVRMPWPTDLELDKGYSLDDAWVETTAWINRHTPAPSLDFSALREHPVDNDFDYPSDIYGVWSGWGFGNQTSHYTRRPVHMSQGADGDSARWLFVRDENRSRALLNAKSEGQERIRYVILDADTLGSQYTSYASDARRHLRKDELTVSHIPYDDVSFPIKVYANLYEQTVAKRLYRDDGHWNRRISSGFRQHPDQSGGL